MKILFLVNDSYFAYLMAEPVIRRYHDMVSLVVLSNKNKGSLSRLWSIYSRSSVHYFLYRSIVQAVSWLVGAFKEQSVARAARSYNIPILGSDDFRTSLESIAAFGPFDVGLAFNCDQKIGDRLLALCGRGVVNVHASKLPDDAGISPVLWAFARGDQSVWSTIYRMDSGIDTGPILAQFEIPVEPGETAFGLYKKVCAESGAALADVLTKYVYGDLKARPQQRNTRRSYFSWPDAGHQAQMRANKRKYLRIGDVLKALLEGRRAPQSPPAASSPAESKQSKSRAPEPSTVTEAAGISITAEIRR
jgi:formyl transferase-like protein